MSDMASIEETKFYRLIVLALVFVASFIALCVTGYQMRPTELQQCAKSCGVGRFKYTEARWGEMGLRLPMSCECVPGVEAAP